MTTHNPNFQFHAELLELRSKVIAALSDQGFEWLSEFGSVDLDHNQYGLEVTAIRERGDAVRIQSMLRGMFPAWRHSSAWYEDQNVGERGWKVVVCRDPDSWNGWWFEDDRQDAAAFDPAAVSGDADGDWEDWEKDSKDRSTASSTPTVPTMFVTVPGLPDEALSLRCERVEPTNNDGDSAGFDPLDSLVALFDASMALRARDRELWPSDARFATRDALAKLADDGAVLLLRRGRELVGGCLLTRCVPRVWSDHPAPAAYLSHLVVQPRLQGQELGRRVLRYAHDVTEYWQRDRVRLECQRENVGLAAYLRGAGFVALGAAADDRCLYERTANCD